MSTILEGTLWTKQEMQLIKEVIRHPPLYEKDRELKYGSKVYNKSWTEVAKNLGLSEKMCKTKWRKIETDYREQVHDTINNKTSYSKYLDGFLFFLKSKVDDSSPEPRSNLTSGQINEISSSETILLDSNSLDSEPSEEKSKREISKENLTSIIIDDSSGDSEISSTSLIIDSDIEFTDKLVCENLNGNSAFQKVLVDNPNKSGMPSNIDNKAAKDMFRLMSFKTINNKRTSRYKRRKKPSRNKTSVPSPKVGDINNAKKCVDEIEHNLLSECIANDSLSSDFHENIISASRDCEPVTSVRKKRKKVDKSGPSSEPLAKKRAKLKKKDTSDIGSNAISEPSSKKLSQSKNKSSNHIFKDISEKPISDSNGTTPMGFQNNNTAHNIENPKHDFIVTQDMLNSLLSLRNQDAEPKKNSDNQSDSITSNIVLDNSNKANSCESFVSNTEEKLNVVSGKAAEILLWNTKNKENTDDSLKNHVQPVLKNENSEDEPTKEDGIQENNDDKNKTKSVDVNYDESDIVLFFDELAEHVSNKYPLQKQREIRSKIMALVTTAELEELELQLEN